MFTLEEEPDDFGAKVEKIFFELAEKFKATPWYAPVGERGVISEDDVKISYSNFAG